MYSRRQWGSNTYLLSAKQNAAPFRGLPYGRLTRALRLRFTSPKPPAAASQSPKTLGESAFMW
jgi:hypothetical protein